MSGLNLSPSKCVDLDYKFDHNSGSRLDSCAEWSWFPQNATTIMYLKLCVLG
jgi:hypothetical protein